MAGARLGLALLACSAGGAMATEEIRTWTCIDGQAVEGRYVSMVMDSVRIEDAAGKSVKLPIEQLSKQDLAYVELRNPPEIKVEYEESAPAREYVGDDWTSSSGGYTAQNSPIYNIEARFGATVKQTSSRPYHHELKIMMMNFTVQNLDRDKYHLIARTTSKPFVLADQNRREYTYRDPQTHNIIYYDLSGKWPRGEVLGEYLILVLDERGEIIAHRSSGKWLYKYRDKLKSLPVGAWVNDEGDQVYPTTPIRSTMD